MTVDMKQAVKGSTVHFRCGGSAVVEDLICTPSNYPAHVILSGSTVRFAQDGRYLLTSNIHPFDIIRIDPPAFDWKDVKRGMGFRYDDYVGSYIGVSMTDSIVLQMISVHDTVYDGFRREDLIRAPEHDVEVDP